MIDSTVPTAPREPGKPREQVVAEAALAAVPADASLLSPEIAARLGRLSLLARRLCESHHRGRRRTRRSGGGVEMVDLRAYAPGDDPRRIAWAAYARMERLLVRLVADEAPMRLSIVIDTSASMRFGAPDKLRQASRIAAGLCAVAIAGEDRVAAIGTSATTIQTERSAGGRNGLARILGLLEGLEAKGKTDLVRAATAITGAAGGRSLCVLLSDMLDPKGALAGARAARAHGHDVALVEVLAPFEIDPPELGEVDLEDDETGETVTLPPGGARAAYVAALARHRVEVDEGAMEIGAPVLRVSTADPFDAIVERALAVGILRAGGPQ